MTSNKNLVANLYESRKTEVRLRTENIVDINGKGVVNISTKKGEPKIIPKVYYVSSIKHNLISVG